MMNNELRSVVTQLRQMQEGGGLPLLFEDIKKDVAARMVQTEYHQVDERNRLYMITQALNELEAKLQDYVNQLNNNSQENH